MKAAQGMKMDPPDFRLLISRAVREQICVFEVTEFTVMCYSMMQNKDDRQTQC